MLMNTLLLVLNFTVTGWSLSQLIAPNPPWYSGMLLGLNLALTYLAMVLVARDAHA